MVRVEGRDGCSQNGPRARPIHESSVPVFKGTWCSAGDELQIPTIFILQLKFLSHWTIPQNPDEV